jgi:hypothetical protein
MNQMQMYESLKTLPKEMLLRYAQNPMSGVPQYMAIAALQYQNEIENSKPMPPPQGTVKDEVIQKAVQPRMPMQAQLPPQPEQPQAQQPVMQAAHGGLAELHVPDHMFQEKHMAGGGIVAFDGGGEVPHFDGTDGSLVSGPMTKEQFNALSPEAQQAYLDAMQMQALQQDEQGIETVHPELLALPAGRALKGVYNLGKARYFTPQAYGPTLAGRSWVTVPQRGLAGVAQDVTKAAAYPFKFAAQRPIVTTAGATGVSGLASLFDSGTPEVPKDRKPMLFPTADKQPMSPEQAAAVLNKNSEVLNQGIASTKNRTAPPTRAGAGAGAGAASQQGLKVLSEDEILDKTRKFSDEALGAAPKEMSLDEAAKENQELYKRYGFDPEMYKNQKADLEKSRAKLGEDKATAINMRIIEAGLGIMSGESPYAFANLKGAIPALKGLGEDINKLSSLDRDIDKEQRTLSVEQNKLAQGLASADQGKVDKSRERIDKFNEKRATTMASVYGHLSNDRTQMAVANLQAQTAREGHAVTKGYYDYLRTQGGSKAFQQIDGLLKSGEMGKLDAIIAEGANPAIAAIPQKAALIASAKQRKAQMLASIQALSTQLKPEEMTIIQATLGGNPTGGTPGHPALKYGG